MGEGERQEEIGSVIDTMYMYCMYACMYCIVHGNWTYLDITVYRLISLHKWFISDHCSYNHM